MCSLLHEEIEKEACFIVGLLAVKPEYQSRIAAKGALPGLVRLLTQYKNSPLPRPNAGSGGTARRAADAITNLAHENSEVKTLVRTHGGIPPLVSLLETVDLKVQRAAAGALRTLAFKNDDNKNLIVECNALPILVQMLKAEDSGVHYEAVGVIGNLVHSSPNIKKKVLEESALQPVINLLSSPCHDSQRESALLLGQFATADAETKIRIVQRGAVPPLVKMLEHHDNSLKEMAAFAIGRLAQNSDNQAGIAHSNGLLPLVELLESKVPNLQHNAAFALYGLADCEDNVPEIVRLGVLQRLLDSLDKVQAQASKDCVQKTINRIESKFARNQAPNSPHLRVLAHVSFLLRSSQRDVRQRAAMALARMAPEDQQRSIFIEKKGLDVILDMLIDPAGLGVRAQKDAAHALLGLSNKMTSKEAITPEPNKTVFLGAQYINNPTLADVSFMVQGKKFYAHRIALLASSDAFNAMFSSGYREQEAQSIDIPNIPFDVFEAMMHYVYTGNVEVTDSIATELLQASDQYLLEGLKRLCEGHIGKDVTMENALSTYELSEAFSAPVLGKRCILYTLEHYDEFLSALGFEVLHSTMSRMIPSLKKHLLSEAKNVQTAVAAGGVPAAGA